MGQIATIMEPNAEAYKLNQSARSLNTLAGVFGAIGGAMIGWNIGESLAGGDPNWALSVAGGAIVLGTIPISNSAMKKARQAIETYNSSYKRKPELYIGFNREKIGFQLNF